MTEIVHIRGAGEEATLFDRQGLSGLGDRASTDVFRFDPVECP